MPSVSGSQHRAMEAAAHGKSTLGIPKTVGQDFSKADTGKKFSTKYVADAIRKRKAQPQVTGDENPADMKGGC